VHRIETALMQCSEKVSWPNVFFLFRCGVVSLAASRGPPVLGEGLASVRAFGLFPNAASRVLKDTLEFHDWLWRAL